MFTIWKSETTTTILLLVVLLYTIVSMPAAIPLVRICEQTQSKLIYSKEVSNDNTKSATIHDGTWR